jgi:hypothetical protein
MRVILPYIIVFLSFYAGTYCEVTDNYKLTRNQVHDNDKLTRNQEIYDNEIDLDIEGDITESGLIERGVISGNDDLITVVSRVIFRFLCICMHLPEDAVVMITE